MDWASLYPAYAVEPSEDEAAAMQTDQPGQEENPLTKRGISKEVEVADIGCGFGGLLFALSPKLPDTLLLGRLIFFSLSIFHSPSAYPLSTKYSSSLSFWKRLFQNTT